MAAKALEVFPEDNMMFGYDIGCSFRSTIAQSSLGPQFGQRQWSTCIPAFHGYTHNYRCQLSYHPLRIRGMGLEDLEVLERVFSSSNAVARTTRFMTAHRRRVYIDLHFQQWDADKYLNLGTMLLNNFKQVFGLIKKLSVDIAASVQYHGLTIQDLDTLIADEAATFNALTAESDGDTRRMKYVELLQELMRTE